MITLLVLCLAAIAYGQGKDNEQVMQVEFSRAGCPPSWPSYKNFLEKRVEIKTDKATLQIIGHASRYYQGRADMYLKRNNDFLDYALSYTIRREWEDMVVAWNGVVNRGVHTFALAGSRPNAYGCTKDNEKNGDMDIVLLPPKTIVYNTRDSRPGCPANHKNYNDLIAKTITFGEATPVEVMGHITRLYSGRVDLNLLIDGKEVVKAISHTPTRQWDEMQVHWVGMAAAGQRKFHLRGSLGNAFGCGGNWGDLDIIAYPTKGVTVKRVGHSKNGCPVRDNQRTLINTSITVEKELQFVKIAGHLNGNRSGKSSLQLRVGGQVKDEARMFTNQAVWEDNFVHWIGKLAKGTYTVDLYSNNINMWGCGDTHGSIDIVQMDEYDHSGFKLDDGPKVPGQVEFKAVSKPKGSFAVMVADMDDFTTRKERFKDMGGANFEGMTWIDVTPGMTAGDVLDMVNEKRISERQWKKNYHDIMKALTDAEKNALKPEWSTNPFRDDRGSFFYRESTERGFSSQNVFYGVFFAGQMLGRSETMRRAGVGPTSILFLRKFKNMNKVFSGIQKLNDIRIDGRQTSLDLQFFNEEPYTNVMNKIASAAGIPITKISMGLKYDKNPNKVELTMDRLELAKPGLSGKAEVLSDRFVGMWPAVEGQRTSPYYTRAGTNRFDPTVTLKSLGDLGTLEMPVTLKDPQAGCSCLTEAVYNTQPLGKKLMRTKYGYACDAHDMKQKHCDAKKIEKGQRKCWCPKKWCYTTRECGLASKLQAGLFYSYNLCVKEQEDCFTTDEEGSIEAQDLSDLDIWEFTRLQPYLRGLLAKLDEKIPEWDE